MRSPGKEQIFTWKMADQVQGLSVLSAQKEMIDLLTEFLINAEVNNGHTLDDFKAAFPPAVRNHNDVKTLYICFQMKRKKLRAIVKRNLSMHFSSSKTEPSTWGKINKPSVIDNRQHLKETLQPLCKGLKEVENELTRCGKYFKDKDVLQHLQEKHFNI